MREERQQEGSCHIKSERYSPDWEGVESRDEKDEDRRYDVRERNLSELKEEHYDARGYE